MIYVDHQKMWADTADEMHAAAERGGIAPKWFSGGPTETFPHYVVNPTRRKALVRQGAVEVGRDGAWRWQTLAWFNGTDGIRQTIAIERIRRYGPRTDLLGPLV